MEKLKGKQNHKRKLEKLIFTSNSYQRAYFRYFLLREDPPFLFKRTISFQTQIFSNNFSINVNKELWRTKTSQTKKYYKMNQTENEIVPKMQWNRFKLSVRYLFIHFHLQHE